MPWSGWLVNFKQEIQALQVKVHIYYLAVIVSPQYT